MWDRVKRIWEIINRTVVSGEGWYAAWQAIKAELGLSSLSPWALVSGAGALIGTLYEDVGWTGVIVLTVAAFVVIQYWVSNRHKAETYTYGALVTRPISEPALPQDSTPPLAHEQELLTLRFEFIERERRLSAKHDEAIVALESRISGLLDSLIELKRWHDVRLTRLEGLIIRESQRNILSKYNETLMKMKSSVEAKDPNGSIEVLGQLEAIARKIDSLTENREVIEKVTQIANVVNSDVRHGTVDASKVNQILFQRQVQALEDFITKFESDSRVIDSDKKEALLDRR